MIALGRAVWKSRWGVLRTAIAAFVLWCLWADGGARLARMELATLPDADFALESRALREEGRFGEAATTAEAGLAHATGTREREALNDELGKAREEQASLLRRVRDVGLGALTGPGGAEEGDEYATLERLGGAIAADLFVVGDVRDLILQGLRATRGEEVDPVITALSVIGIATTVTPEGDWIPSLLKSARKLGTLTKKLTDFLIAAARARDVRAIRAVVDDVGVLAKHGSPGAAVRLLRFADAPADVARLARFAEKRGAAGVKALEHGGRHAADALAEAERVGDVAQIARTEETLIRASRKGPAMSGWMQRGTWRALAKPHPLIGLVKGLYKGSIAAFVQRVLEAMDVAAWWVMGACAAWLVLELGIIGGRLSNAWSKTERGSSA